MSVQPDPNSHTISAQEVLICFCFALLFDRQALNVKVNPLYLMASTAVATSFAFMLPVATPPNAIVFSYGHLRVIDMVSDLMKSH